MNHRDKTAPVLRIALIDDHSLFREGLCALLSSESDLLVVAQASDARSAYPLLETTSPDMAVVDVSLPGTSGIALTREILRRWPKFRVLMLTMHASEEYVVRALAAGATGYALKSQPANEVIVAIRAVGEGRLYLAPSLPRASFDGALATGGEEAGVRLNDLSPREREIFDMLVRNDSNVEVAEHLCISVKTVQTHRASINRKLHVHSTAELIRFAALRGLIHV